MSDTNLENQQAKRAERGVGTAILKYVPSQVLPNLLAFAIVPVLTRMTDRSEYGMFVLGVTIVTIINQSAYSWVPNCALRFYKPMRGESAYYFHLFLSYLFTTAALLLFLVPAWPLMSDKYQDVLLWAGPIVLCASGIMIMGFILRAQDRALAFGLMTSLNMAMRYLPAIAAAMIFGPTFQSLLGGWLVGYLFNLTVMLFMSGAYRKLRPTRIDTAKLRDFLLYGGPLMATGLIAAVTNSADRLILDSKLGVEELAIYGVCIQLGYVPMKFAAKTTTLAILPMAIDAYEDQRDISALIVRGIRYLFLVCLPIGVVFGTLGGDLLPIYATPEYASGADAIPFLLAAGVLLSLCHYYRVPFLVTKRTYVLVPIGIFTLVISVVANLILIPIWGVAGCAVALMLTNFLLLVMTAIRASREVHAFPSVRSVGHLLLAGVVAVGVGLGLREVIGSDRVWMLGVIALVELVCYAMVVCTSAEGRNEARAVYGLIARRLRRGA